MSSVDAGDSVRWVASQMRARRDDFIAGLVSVTRAQISSLDHDAQMVDLLDASITENVVAAIHFLEHGGAEDDVGAANAALMYARALAQRDVPLSALIRAYRIGHGRFVDQAMTVLASRFSAEQSLPATVELVRRTAFWIDRVCDLVGVAYEQERDRWVSSRSGLRSHWVNEVLNGAVIGVSRAEAALDYRFDRCHVGAVMWPDPTVATRDVAAVFDQARSWVDRQLGAAGESLIVPTDERQARVWWPVRDTATDAGSLDTSTSDLDSAVRIAIGQPAHGVDGFRLTMRQAEQAKVVAVAGGSALARVVTHREVAPIALMAADIDELRRFIQRVLGDLAIDEERNLWLRETLREFLIRNRSFAATAGALFLHRNTIQYRINQAVDICGITLDEPDSVMNVQIALLACRWMGSSMLISPRSP